MVKTVKVGQHVKFWDSQRVQHDALITAVWGKGEWDDEKPVTVPDNWPPAVNLVYVLKEENMKDQYGQQTMHGTSVAHASYNAAAGGYMWDVA